jgi:membrane protease YdiL (CAAX protease family)
MQTYSHWIVLAYAVVASLCTYSRTFFGELPDAFIFYFALPVAIIVLLKGRLRDHGLALGDWKQGLLWTSVFVTLSLATTWFAVHSMPGIRRYYYGEIFGWALIGNTVAYMAAWEFFFRGFLLFGLKKLGFAAANIIQTIIFFLMHIGKPAPELYSTLMTGLIFGYLTYRCKSVIPMIIIHSAIFLSVVFFATR